MRHFQHGVGMVEVLVSLVILAIAVLGFAALQFKALEAVQESNDRTSAMTLARDLAERIRVNRTQLSVYKSQLNAASNQSAAINCVKADTTTAAATTIVMCSRSQMAAFDVVQIKAYALQKNMQMVMSACQGGDRQCIYVAWGDTQVSADNQEHCMKAGVYLAGAQCLVMEAYGQ